MAMIHPHPRVRVTTGIRTGIARMDRSPTRTGREIAATPGTRWRPDSVNVPDSSRWEITVIQSPLNLFNTRSHGLVRGIVFCPSRCQLCPCESLVNASDIPVFARDLFMFCLWSLDLYRLNYICFLHNLQICRWKSWLCCRWKKSLFLRIKSCSSPLGARSAVEKTLGTKLGPEGRRCFAWQCSRMQPVDSPCEVRPSKRTCIEKERQPIYNYTVVYVGVYIYI